MKAITLTIVIYFTALWAQGQTATTWDSTYRPGAYKLRKELYESYPHTAKDIVFLGNSITYGADWTELLQLPKAKNRGISGDITFGVLDRLDEVIKGHPAKVFILIGINDISRNIPDSVILHNDERMIQRIKAGSPHTKIYFQTLMPVNNTFTQFINHYNKDEHIAAVNEGLKRLAAKYHITLIDLHPHFLDSEGRLIKEDTYDGLHPNAKGYALWAKILRPYLK